MELYKATIVIKMKTCTGCNQTKELTEFSKLSRAPDGLQYRCKVCNNTRSRKHYKANGKKVRATVRKYKQNNPEKSKASSKKYYQNNLEKRRASARKSNKRPEVKKRKNAWQRERRKTDPQYKLRCNLRRRLSHALKGKNKSASTMKLLGCSYTHAQNHLAEQFQPGMTWENHGTWHIDHMMPCASFDLSCPEQQRRCFHYTNLQPMWGKENMSKRDKIIYNREWNGFRWINIA